MSELLCITKKKIQFPLWDLKLKQLYLSSSHTNNRYTLGKLDRFVILFLSWWVCAVLLAQAMASDKPPEPIHGEAQMLRPYSNSESREETLQAGTVNGRLGTEVTDNKTTEEIALWLSWSQTEHCGQFLFLLLGKRSGSPLNGIYIFVLCSTNDCQALFDSGVQIFPLVLRTIC